jgi:hypothetical protein
MKKKNSKADLFDKLNIKKSEYPPYTDAEHFAQGIKQCSLLKPHEIRYSNTSASQDTIKE